MLEKVKEVLIIPKQELLKKKKHLEEEYENLQMIEKKESCFELDKELEEIEEKIESLKDGFLKKLIHGKKIKKLYIDYLEISNQEKEKRKKISRVKDKLLQELYRTIRDKSQEEEEIKRIKQAKSLEELGLTEEQAKKLLDNYNSDNGYSIIQNVFLDNQYITTKEEIMRAMQKLYQTNSSQFVLAMNEITLEDLMNDLKEVQITLEEEKVTYLNKVIDYINNISSESFPEIKEDILSDEIESYYYNHSKKIVEGLKKYNSNKITVKSYLMSLTVLTSIAKRNQKETQ